MKQCCGLRWGESAGDGQPPRESAAARGRSTRSARRWPLDPQDPRARYFLAVKKDIDKDHEGAIAAWLDLLADSPPGAPWEADLVRTIEQVGGNQQYRRIAPRLAKVQENRTPGILAPGAGSLAEDAASSRLRGPSAAEVAAAGRDDPEPAARDGRRDGRPARSAAAGSAGQPRWMGDADAQPHDLGRTGRGESRARCGGKGQSGRGRRNCGGRRRPWGSVRSIAFWRAGCAGLAVHGCPWLEVGGMLAIASTLAPDLPAPAQAGDPGLGVSVSPPAGKAGQAPCQTRDDEVWNDRFGGAWPTGRFRHRCADCGSAAAGFLQPPAPLDLPASPLFPIVVVPARAALSCAGQGPAPLSVKCRNRAAKF